MGLRYGLFFSSAALANCFASALAYGLLQANTSIQGWQLLFIVEGSPTMLLAILARFVLPESPKQAKFLTARENEIISSRSIKGRGIERDGQLNSQQAFAAFYDYKNYLSAVIIFCINVRCCPQGYCTHADMFLVNIQLSPSIPADHHCGHRYWRCSRIAGPHGTTLLLRFPSLYRC